MAFQAISDFLSNIMKKILLLLAAALLPVASFAADGNIDLTGNIRPTTCVVNTPRITIPLTSTAGISTTIFTSVGRESSWTSAVPITLDCTGNTADVYMTVTDATTPGNTSTTLTLTASSTATGVGIQLSVCNSPKMRFGPDSSAIGNTNQFLVSTANSATGTVTINLCANYIQTLAAVSSGTANGAATFTMAYK